MSRLNCCKPRSGSICGKRSWRSHWVPAWRKRAKRRVVESLRFYALGARLVNDLAWRGTLKPGSAEFGAAFEHFVFMGIRAHAACRGNRYPVAYRRTTSGFEVHFILGDGALADDAWLHGVDRNARSPVNRGRTRRRVGQGARKTP